MADPKNGIASAIGAIFRPAWGKVRRLLPQRDPALKRWRQKLAEMDRRFNQESEDLVDLARQLRPLQARPPLWKRLLLSGWKKRDALVVPLAIVWALLWLLLHVIADGIAHVLGHHWVVHGWLEFGLDGLIFAVGALVFLRLGRRCLRVGASWIDSEPLRFKDARLAHAILAFYGAVAMLFVVPWLTTLVQF